MLRSLQRCSYRVEQEFMDESKAVLIKNHSSIKSLTTLQSMHNLSECEQGYVQLDRTTYINFFLYQNFPKSFFNFFN